MDGYAPWCSVPKDSVWAVSAETEVYEEAMAFLEFMFSPEVQRRPAIRGMPVSIYRCLCRLEPIKDDAKRLLDTYVGINFSTKLPGLSVDDTSRLIRASDRAVQRTSEFAEKYAALWDAAY